MKKLILILILLLSSSALSDFTPFDPNNPDHTNVIGQITAEVGAVITRDLNCYDINGVYETNFLLIDMINRPPESVQATATEIDQPHDHDGEACTRSPCLWYSAQWAWMPTEDDVGYYEFLIACEDSFQNTDYAIVEVTIYLHNNAPVIEVIE